MVERHQHQAIPRAAYLTEIRLSLKLVVYIWRKQMDVLLMHSELGASFLLEQKIIIVLKQTKTNQINYVAEKNAFKFK